MPPKANKPAAPKKPTKPSAKSKTGNTACSQAASNWQLSIRGKEPLDPQTYATLAKCRAMTRTAKQADDRARMGYNLNDQGAAALKGRLQKRFDQGLITQKSRDERLKMLLQQRKEKQAAVAAKPADKAASLVSSVRQKPGYGVARASAAGNRELVGLKMRNKGQVTTQPAFTLKQSSSQGGTGAGRSMGVLFQTEGTALDKAAQAGQKAPLAGQGSLFRGAAIDNKTTRRLEFNEAKRQAYSGTLNLSRESLKRIKIGGMEVTTSERPGIYNVFHSVTGRQMGIIDTTLGKDHRISTESYGYSEKNAQNLKKISEEMRKIQLRSEIGTLASRQSMSGPSSYVFGRLAGKKPEDYRISYNPSTRKPTQPPKPAFSRQGQKAPLPGQAGMFASENQTGKPPKYVLEAGFTTWKQVNKFGLNNIVKDAPSIAKAAVDPTRNKYAGGSRDWIENDIASRIVKMTRIHGNKQLAIKAVAREYELQSQRQQEAGMPEVYKSISSELYKSSDLYNYKLNSQSQPPKPFSRQGQPAPGRGTEERKNLAQAKAEARKLINDTTVKVSSNSFYYNSHDPEKRAKTYSAGYTKDIQSNMRGQVKRAKTANDAKVILDVLKQHVTGMKTRIAAWANAESRTASWAVTGRGNFNSSRNSKRMDSAMNKSQEISDYSKGLENAVSRALLKKSDTGTAITRLAKIRTRLERRKSKLNSDKQIQTRTAVYSARGLDEFANATKEDRSQALKNSMGQLKQIDKDRKTILGRLKKITAAESNLKMQTRISRAL